jgi:Cu/Ag efflux pump CusA
MEPEVLELQQNVEALQNQVQELERFLKYKRRKEEIIATIMLEEDRRTLADIGMKVNEIYEQIRPGDDRITIPPG